MHKAFRHVWRSLLIFVLSGTIIASAVSRSRRIRKAKRCWMIIRRNRRLLIPTTAIWQVFRTAVNYRMLQRLRSQFSKANRTPHSSRHRILYPRAQLVQRHPQ